MLNCSWLVCSRWRTALVLFGLLCSSNRLSAQELIVPPDAKLEKLFESKVLTEGVSVAPDGMVYFSEITFSHVSRDENGAIDAGFIWKFDPATKATSIFRSPSGMSNGIKFDAAGNMIVAEGADYGGRKVTRTDMKTGKAKIIAGLFEGQKLNSPNDITIDEKGRIYFSDPRYLGPAGCRSLSHRYGRLTASDHHGRRQGQRCLRVSRPEDALRCQQRKRWNRHRPTR